MNSCVCVSEHLQSTQICQTTEHPLSQMTDGVFSQVQALQETQSYKSCVLESSQVIIGQISAENSHKRKHSWLFNICIDKKNNKQNSYNDAFS